MEAADVMVTLHNVTDRPANASAIQSVETSAAANDDTIPNFLH